GLLAKEAGRCSDWKTPTGSPKPPHACAAGLPSWARCTCDVGAASALIDADEWLIADATCAVLAIAPWCANSPSIAVSACINPARSWGRLPAMVFVGRLPHGPPETPSAFRVALSHAWPSRPYRSARVPCR